ncbi:MAG: 8-amino-7-oxononanoate synthase, partial [Candidatus Omnitrophota bacterium]
MAVKEFSNSVKINSDNHTLADFATLPNKDLFAKTGPCYEYIEDWKSKGTYTLRRKILSACKNRVLVYDELIGKPRVMIMMASNSYLGLNTHPRIIEAGTAALKKYGSGVSGSPVLNGTYDLLRELEEKIAWLKGCEDAALFPTGYSANVGIIS